MRKSRGQSLMTSATHCQSDVCRVMLENNPVVDFLVIVLVGFELPVVAVGEGYVAFNAFRSPDKSEHMFLRGY